MYRSQTVVQGDSIYVINRHYQAPIECKLAVFIELDILLGISVTLFLYSNPSY